MPSTHLIVVIIWFFIVVAIIYSSSFTFEVLGDIKKGSIDCIPEQKSNIVNCCYKESDTDTGETTAIYCAQCYDDGTGNLACDAYDKVESIKPPDDDSTIPPKGTGGLLGLLDGNSPTIQPGDSTIPPKGKGGLLGLLDETNPTIQQQPFPESTKPQRNIPNDLLSNLNDNLMTSVPKEDSNEPLNLLQDDEQQESPTTETDSNNANTLKEADKEETKEEEQQEQQPSLEEQSQEEISANQEDEIESDEVEEEEKEQQQPPIAETIKPNAEFVN
jgi:hypothetical protein